MTMSLKMIRRQDHAWVVSHGIIANTYFTRLKGLMGKTEFQSGEGLLFPRCNSIHMWMMKLSIDVVFLKKQNQDWKIVGLHSNVKPWKLLPVSCFKADDTLELPVSTIERLGLKVGEVLCIA